MKEDWSEERKRKVEGFKSGRVLEGHFLLLYQYMSVYNKFSFDT